MRWFRIALCVVATLGVASAGDATVIDVVVRDIGESGGRLGSAADPLQVGDLVGIDLLLGHNPHPDGPSDDGYLLSSMDVDLAVTGSGSLAALAFCRCGYVFLLWNQDLDTFSPMGPHSGDELTIWELEDNAQEGFTADSLYGLQGPAILLQGLGIRADAPGIITVDLSLGGLTVYSEYGGWPGPGSPWDWIAASDADLGDLTLRVVPEPGTLLLLGMGLALLPRVARS